MQNLVKEFRSAYYTLKDFFAGHGGKLFIVEANGRIYAAFAIRNLGKRIIGLAGGREIDGFKILTLGGHVELLSDKTWIWRDYGIPVPKFDFGWKVTEHRFVLEMVERGGRKRRLNIFKLGLEDYFQAKGLPISLLRKAKKILKGPPP